MVKQASVANTDGLVSSGPRFLDYKSWHHRIRRQGFGQCFEYSVRFKAAPWRPNYFDCKLVGQCCVNFRQQRVSDAFFASCAPEYKREIFLWVGLVFSGPTGLLLKSKKRFWDNFLLVFLKKQKIEITIQRKAAKKV